MIAGIIIRNFKIYKSCTYIPLSNGTSFNGLIGPNGVGKSSVLEALDCFFNGKPWIKNIDTASMGDSWVMPVFAFTSGEIDWSENEVFVGHITSYVKEILTRELSSDVTTKNYEKPTSDLKNHISSCFSEYDYLVPICLTGEGSITTGLFNTGDFKTAMRRIGDYEPNTIEPILANVYHYIKERLTYVYIPKDIEAENLVRFENEDIQHLFDSSLYDKVSSILTQSNIKDISRNLKDYIDEISSKIEGYRFKARTTNQPNLKPAKIYDLIIEEFFSLRELFKTTNDGKDIPLGQLSSGEKQQALIALIYYIVTQYRTRNTNLVVAVDEPEASLHIALCYGQFEKLFDVSNFCSQVLFTSHWYGFIPALVDGCFCHISQANNVHDSCLFNIEQYREEIRHREAALKGQLPIDVMLKSTNDLVQSILSSIIKEDAYNWLICEGSSDMIYLKAYLSEEVLSKKLRVIPVCKATEIKKIYSQICAALEDLKKEANGRIFMLTDTDINALSCSTNSGLDGIVRWRRIVNDETNKITKLVKVDPETNPKAPNTDIEDALNGKLFGAVVRELKNSNEVLNVITSDDLPDEPSYFAIDLKPSDYLKLKGFFDDNRGENKVIFAKKYVELMSTSKFSVPSWIVEIKNYFVEQ